MYLLGIVIMYFFIVVVEFYFVIEGSYCEFLFGGVISCGIIVNIMDFVVSLFGFKF